MRSDGIEIACHAQAKGRHQVVLLREHTNGLWPRREVMLPEPEPFDAPLARYEEAAG